MVIKTFKLNDTEIHFPVSDPLFVAKLEECGERLMDMQTEDFPSEDFFGYLKSKDKTMREMIDECFGYPISADVFGNYSVFAVDEGFPVWLNLLFFCLERMEDSIAEETEKSKKKIARYTAKYHK